MSSSKALPAISHLQFLALGVLTTGDQPGRVIRDTAAEWGVKSSAAAFYQLMARLERDGLVDGWYEQVRVGDQAVTERHYRITPRGARACQHAREFYASVGRVPARPRLSNA